MFVLPFAVVVEIMVPCVLIFLFGIHTVSVVAGLRRGGHVW